MKNKAISTLIICVIYITMGLLGFYLNKILLISSEMLKFLIIDLIMTIYVFIFSLIFKNASVYDPYWSVTPLILIFYYFYNHNYTVNINTFFMLGIMVIWGIRLTVNWLIRFKNLTVEDWRYQAYRNKKGFFFINLGGFHLMPTILVFLAMMPVFKYFENCLSYNLNLASLIAVGVGLFGIVLEIIADNEINTFKKTNKEKGAFIKTGLFKNSRHPNYLGEILVWLSAFLLNLSINSNDYLLGLGILLIFLMFAVITAPMMDKRQLTNKIGYKEYMEKTNSLLIYPVLKK